MGASKKLILVLGMHRSGTSALTRMLNLLGADLGNQLLEALQGVNEQGFWEHRELVEINEALLTELGTHWYDFRSLPAKWWKQKNLAHLRTRARGFLDTVFENKQLAVIKDPRLCLLLPFWEFLIKKSGWQPVAVIAIRAPWEVAASLCRRDPLDESTANLLWLRYFHDAEISSKSLPRCVVDYQDLLTDWRAQAKTISKRLDIAWPVDRSQIDPLIDTAIDPSLRHQATRFKSSDIHLSSLATRVYHQLQNMDASAAKLETQWREFEALFNTCDVMGDTVAAANTRLIEINVRLHLLGNEHQQALDVIQQRDKQLKTLNTKVEALGRVHHEALKMVEVRDSQLAEVNKQIQTLGEQHKYAQGVVKERDEQLQQVNQNLQQLSEEHRDALAVVVERDDQLQQLNQKLQQLGEEHAAALAIVDERDAQLQQLTRKLEQLGEEHAAALAMVDERDAQLQQFTRKLEQLGEEHAAALAMVDERDAQLQQFTQKLEQLGEEHAAALAIVDERDAQLQQFTQKLEQLGEQHAYALDIVAERDDQLQTRNAEYEHLAAEYLKLRSHPMVKGLVKLLSLEDK